MLAAREATVLALTTYDFVKFVHVIAIVFLMVTKPTP